LNGAAHFASPTAWWRSSYTNIGGRVLPDCFCRNRLIGSIQPG